MRALDGARLGGRVAARRGGPGHRKRDDLLLWSTLLNRCSKDGISINNITFTTPTDITVSDACEVGMGGFNMSGLAWRYELPESMHGKLTINLLEFIAASITVYLTVKATSQP